MEAGACEFVDSSIESNGGGESGVLRLTVGEVLDRFGFHRFQWRMLLICGFCWGADAVELMLLSFLLPAITEEWQLTPVRAATVGSAAFTGMMVGAYLLGWLADRHGRRLAIFLMAVGTTLFGAASAFSPNWIVMCVLRALCGVALGAAPVAVSLFAEFLPTPHRGRWLVLFELSWTVGTVSETLLAWLVIPLAGWRLFVLLSNVPMALLALLCYWVPESPRYLFNNRREPERALDVLQAVADSNRVPFVREQVVLQENVSLLAQQQETARTTATATATATAPAATAAVAQGLSGVRELFSRRFLCTTLVLWFLWFANALIYYGLVLFTPIFLNQTVVGDSAQSFDSDNQMYIDVLVSTMGELPGVLVAALLIDLIGRRYTQSLMFASLSLYTCLLLVPSNSQWTYVLLCFLARGLSMGVYCATYAYTPELYPTRIRSVGLGLCVSASKVASVLSPFISNVLIEVSPTIPISIFASLSLASSLLILVLRETSEDDLE